MKKSFIKDKLGCPILPVETKNIVITESENYLQLKKENEVLTNDQKELKKELASAYDTIDLLKNINHDREHAIKDLTNDIKLATECEAFLTKAHNENRIKFELAAVID